MPREGGYQGIAAPLRRRHSGKAPRPLVLAASCLAALAVLGALPVSASADVGSDQAQINALEQKIAQQGAAVEDLVATYNKDLIAEALAANRVVAAQARLAADQQVEDKDMTVLRAIALSSYMSDSQDNSSLALFSTASAASLSAQQEYLRIANRTLRDAVDAVSADVRQTEQTAAQLRAAQAQAQANLDAAAAAKDAAQAALAQDDALLAQVKGNLAALLEQQQQREQAEELALAQAQAAANPVNVTFTPSPGTYVNPLSHIADLTPERVDQGVDYHGYGPIAALGDGRILSTSNSGWPGGTFIAYKLTDGPAAGLVVYAAEDIEPLVSVGQTVAAGQTIGTMYEGPDGIETGWSDPSGDGETMARDDGQFDGSNSTAFGANFSQLLASLGAPPGVMQNEPPTGSLPPGWPQW
jgi:murein DD-endopeptidase MepM/ murein hydrolase activator NlpD